MAGGLLWAPPVFAQVRRRGAVRDGRSPTPGAAAVVAAVSVFLVVLAAVTWGLALLTT